MSQMSQITFSSCFYIIKSKFNAEIYVTWMNQLISIVNNFNLVIYTDDTSSKLIKTNDNPRIKIIIKPIDQFYCYQYRKDWIRNHEQNILLNNMSGWELNMLWSEKVHFVFETMQNNYFDTEFYGWCDIGYFRNREYDTHTSQLTTWPCDNKLKMFDKTKIHYACVNNNKSFIKNLCHLIYKRSEIPPNQTSIAGGFFILHKTRVEWWKNTYSTKMEEFFKNKYLIKDDQIIIANCVFSDLKNFYLHYESNDEYDNWFMFQRILLYTDEHLSSQTKCASYEVDSNV